MTSDEFPSATKLLQSYTLILLVILTFAYAIRHYFLKPKNFPPGPSGLPIVGYLPFLGKERHLDLQKLKMKYGGIYSLLLGSRPIVVVASYEVMKEAYQKSSLLGRPSCSVFDAVRKIKGVGTSSGEEWTESRKFFMKSVRRFGDKLDNDIEKEIMYLLKKISDANGKPLDFTHMVSSSILNLVMDFLMDLRFDFEDPAKILLDESVVGIFKNIGMISYPLHIPWLQPFSLLEIYFDKFWKKLAKTSVGALKRFEKFADEFDKENIKNYSDAFLHEMEIQRNNPETYYTVEGYLGNLLLVIGAGSDTVALSLSWTMLALASHPEMQKKVHDEIRLAFGNDGKPRWEDRIRLPYTQAVIMETQRWRTILPLPGFRKTLSDIKIQGYLIPKETTILVNLWGLHNDPNYWESPEKFQPKRFLSEDRSSTIKPKSFVPFSYGKRGCPAEGIAYKEIFLYLTSILQKYTIVWPENYEPDLEGITNGGITLIPKPHRLSFVPHITEN